MTAIIASRPIFARLLAILVLYEASRGKRWTSVLIGFVGAVIIIRAGPTEHSTGDLLAPLAALTMAVLSIILKPVARGERPDTIVIWQMIVFTPCSMVPALFVWVKPRLEQLALLIGVGLFRTANQRALLEPMIQPMLSS